MLSDIDIRHGHLQIEKEPTIKASLTYLLHKSFNLQFLWSSLDYFLKKHGRVVWINS